MYPNIADSILTSVCLPVVSPSLRKTFTRPDTLRLFVPPEEDYESDEEAVREKERKKIKDKYKRKSIKKVSGKIKNDTGQVEYKITWHGTEEPEVNCRCITSIDINVLT